MASEVPSPAAVALAGVGSAGVSGTTNSGDSDFSKAMTDATGFAGRGAFARAFAGAGAGFAFGCAFGADGFLVRRRTSVHDRQARLRQGRRGRRRRRDDRLCGRRSFSQCLGQRPLVRGDGWRYVGDWRRKENDAQIGHRDPTFKPGKGEAGKPKLIAAPGQAQQQGMGQQGKQQRQTESPAIVAGAATATAHRPARNGVRHPCCTRVGHEPGNRASAGWRKRKGAKIPIAQVFRG